MDPKQQLEQAEAKITKLESTVEEAEARIKDLLEQLSTGASRIVSLQSELAEVKEHRLAMTEENDRLVDQNEELSKAFDELKAAVKLGTVPALRAALPEVEVAGKRYRFQLPRFNFQGRRWLADEAALDEDVLTALLNLPGQTLLRELV